jgi:uncharacterized membrane protein
MPPQQNSFILRCRGDFVTGLAMVMPAVISVAVVVWLFTNVSNLTDTLLFFLPKRWTHEMHADGRTGAMYWYWSCGALLLTGCLICLVGRYGRYYVGRKAIELTDHALMRIPLLNKIYGTVKQVNESFSNNKSSFKQVVLVSFPHAQARSIGFVTGEQTGLGKERLISVFVPTTPNPTSGFLLLVPESQIIKLDISVADGIKFVISLGAIAPGLNATSISVLDEGSLAKSPLDPGRPALQ